MKTWANFHDGTTADFEACSRPAAVPDFVSPSGSRYWQRADGVVREADHWGPGIRSCNWFFAGGPLRGLACGFCPWPDFRAEPMEVPAYRAWRAEVEAACAAMRADRERIAALQKPGTRVAVVRRTLERTAGGHFSECIEKITFEIARFTAQFVVAADGRRFGLHTIQEWAAA